MLPLVLMGGSSGYSPTEPQQSRVRKGVWSQEEDSLLRLCIEKHGAVKWGTIPQLAGLKRCRKSCRLRWVNYLDPSIKRGSFCEGEDDLIMRLHKLLGNRWSLIAGRIPGRTANDIKNYWNSHLSRRKCCAQDNKKDGVGYTSMQLIKPQPRRIPKNWIWPKEVIVDRGEHQKDESSTNGRPSKGKMQEAFLEDRTVFEEGLNLSSPHAENMMIEELETRIGVENFMGGDPFFEEDTSWESFLSNIELWN